MFVDTLPPFGLWCRTPGWCYGQVAADFPAAVRIVLLAADFANDQWPIDHALFFRAIKKVATARMLYFGNIRFMKTYNIFVLLLICGCTGEMSIPVNVVEKPESNIREIQKGYEQVASRIEAEVSAIVVMRKKIEMCWELGILEGVDMFTMKQGLDWYIFRHAEFDKARAVADAVETDLKAIPTPTGALSSNWNKDLIDLFLTYEKFVDVGADPRGSLAEFRAATQKTPETIRTMLKKLSVTLSAKLKDQKS